MPLTNIQIKNAAPKEKKYKLSDSKGMYLLVTEAGSKYFRFDYRFGGKRKTLALGVYPEISLAEARRLHSEARKLLKNGIDPSRFKKEEKYKLTGNGENTFNTVALEWFAKAKNAWSEQHAKTTIRRLEKNVLPFIGNRPIDSITPPEILSVLRRIEDRGAVETAHRVNQICSQIFRFAVATGRAERDYTADLRGALSSTQTKHMATITAPEEVGALLRAIDGYQGNILTKCALQLAPLVFVRPGELRKAEWAEIDFEEAFWKIPARKMKMRRPHIVPLSSQAIEVLKELKPITGTGRYVFPSLRTVERPMSNNTLLAALRRMGYSKDEMTVHGFRAMASTLLHELGWESEVIERQLAHAERNTVKAAYNHAQHLEKRIKMMQAWADYLDKLKKTV